MCPNVSGLTEFKLFSNHGIFLMYTVTCICYLCYPVVICRWGLGVGGGMLKLKADLVFNCKTVLKVTVPLPCSLYCSFVKSVDD
jgi:hypothetical protein